MPAPSRPLAVIAAAALAFVVAACSSGSSPTPSMVSTTFMNGVAQVSLTGGYTMSYPAQLIQGALVGGGAGMSVSYLTVQTGGLTYQGPATPGTYKTLRTDTQITTLNLTVVLTSGDKPSDSFPSTGGECEVTIVEMSQAKGNATFTCTNLKNQDGTVTVNASGTFSVLP